MKLFILFVVIPFYLWPQSRNYSLLFDKKLSILAGLTLADFHRLAIRPIGENLQEVPHYASWCVIVLWLYYTKQATSENISILFKDDGPAHTNISINVRMRGDNYKGVELK